MCRCVVCDCVWVFSVYKCGCDVCVCVCVCVWYGVWHGACVEFTAHHCLVLMVSCDRRKLKERITQLDSENTALTRAHVER